jgi:hypothetical protein
LIERYPQRLQYVSCDVSKTVQIDAVLAAAQATFGPSISWSTTPQFSTSRRCSTATRRCTIDCSL